MRGNVAQIADRWVMNTYRREPLTFVEGKGTWLIDNTGARYLDFVGGIAVNALGHGHPKVVEAVVQQASKLTHVSNLYYTKPMAELAERLGALLGWDDARVFFSNSGAEANECAIKLVRKWGRLTSGPNKYETVAAFGSFHGRTLETLAATGQPQKWSQFAPLPPGFIHVAFDDAEAIKQVIRPSICSVLLEPVQGEGGVVVPSPDYLKSVAALCEEHSLAFICDEVQTGLGRLGAWFGFEDSGAVPDVITLAKALGGGLPIGACVARGELAETFEPSDHATTLGGGPVVCAAALAVLDVIEKEDLIDHAAEMGRFIGSRLQSLRSSQDKVSEIRGKGLLWAIQLTGDQAAAVVALCRESGVLVNAVTSSAIRLSPPLNVSPDECTLALEAINSAIGKLEPKGRG